MTPAAFSGLDLLATAVVLLDSELKVQYVNPAAETLFAVSRKGILEQSFPALFVDSGPLQGLLQQVIRDERGFADQDLQLVPAGHEALHLNCIATPVDLPQAALLLELQCRLGKIDRRRDAV